MKSKVLETDWNVIINVGIDCGIQYITKRAGIRYYSSPFDSIQSVSSLVTISELIAQKFDGYMDDKKYWPMERYGRGRKSTKCIRYPEWGTLLYPHIYRSWLPGMKKWSWREFNRGPADWNVDLAWERFKTKMWNRQQRLVSLLESENKVLFLRIDQVRSRAVPEIFPNNKQEHYDLFMSNIRKAYPNSSFGCHYVYGREADGTEREPLDSSEWALMEHFPEWQRGNKKAEHWDSIIDILKKIKLLPRDEMKPFEFEKVKFYK